MGRVVVTRGEGRARSDVRERDPKGWWTLAGPVGYATASFAIVAAMVRWPGQAGHAYAAFAGASTLLYWLSGPLWSFLLIGTASFVGVLVVLFSASPWTKLAFVFNIAFLWTLGVFLARASARSRDLANGFDEEIDGLERDIAGLSAAKEELGQRMRDAQEQMASYRALQSVADDLIGAHSRQELFRRAKKALESMFPHCAVAVYPASAAASDRATLWTKTVLESPQPSLFPSRFLPVPSVNAGRFLFVPLRTSEARPQGWIEIESGHADKMLGTRDLRLASIVGDLVAMAIGNAELFSRTEALAVSDGLTGLYVRSYLNERLEEEAAKCRHRGGEFSFILADVDHFKEINDRHGHRLGDETLRSLSRLIAGRIRDSDIAARFGGDEFAVLLPNTKREEAAEFAGRLLRGVEGFSIRWGSHRIRITLSIGVSSFSANDDADAIVRRADDALYDSKRSGRNCVSVR